LKTLKGLVLTAVALLVAAPAAFAGTATYNSTGPIDVGHKQTVTSTITVPPGRGAVQSIEITNFRVEWAASAQELSTQIIAPDGTAITLFSEGCLSYDIQNVYVFSDAGAQLAPNAKDDPKCNLPGGTFRPADPQNKKLSIFSGRQATGNWRLQATDDNGNFTNQGDIESWAVKIVHAPPTLNASAPASLKLRKNLAVNVLADLNGTVVTGGDAKQRSTALTAGAPTAIPFAVGKKIRKKVAKKGKATVKIDLAFTDETGGTASSTVTVKLRGKKK
jgi:subtilisin-like proprotein convertase family protein